jgi:hypothetical protein
MAQGIHFQVEPKKKKKKNGIFFRGLEPMYMIGSIITKPFSAREGHLH